MVSIKQKKIGGQILEAGGYVLLLLSIMDILWIVTFSYIIFSLIYSILTLLSVSTTQYLNLITITYIIIIIVYATLNGYYGYYIIKISKMVQRNERGIDQLLIKIKGQLLYSLILSLPLLSPIVMIGILLILLGISISLNEIKLP